MQAFLGAYPNAAISVLWLVAGGFGAGCGFFIGRNLWRMLAGRVEPPFARQASLTWYACWAIILGAVFFGTESAALSLAYGQDAINTFLFSTSNWTSLIPLALLVVGALATWRMMRVVPPACQFSHLRALWYVIRLPLGILFAIFVVFALCRVPVLNQQEKAQAVVAQIESRKITLDEVMGKDLPPSPDPAKVDATVAGVDANGNGIRDDVELAIFKLHPDSARIRAAELQYAMALQNEITDVFNSNTLVVASQEEGRAYFCLSDALPKPPQISNWDTHDNLVDQDQKEIQDLVLNDDERKQARENAFKFMISHGDLGGSNCDIEVSTLPN